MTCQSGLYNQSGKRIIENLDWIKLELIRFPSLKHGAFNLYYGKWHSFNVHWRRNFVQCMGLMSTQHHEYEGKVKRFWPSLQPTWKSGHMSVLPPMSMKPCAATKKVLRSVAVTPAPVQALSQVSRRLYVRSRTFHLAYAIWVTTDLQW